MLSCSCDFDSDGWYYYPPDDFSTFNRKRRKRCCSCNNLIDISASCVEFGRYRSPVSYIEERIYGGEVELASWYLCEWCGEMFFNLEARGYCMFLGDRMKENIEDYWNMTGFKPDNQSLHADGQGRTV